jgi:anti-sigma factor RsiW
MSTFHPAELQLLDYVEGSLSGDELRSMRRHVGECAACQETLRELTHAVDVLDRLPTVGAPDGNARLRQARNRRRLLRRALPIFAIVVAAGAVVQELRPSATGSAPSESRTPITFRPKVQSVSLVAHAGASESPRQAVSIALKDFGATIRTDHGRSIVALVDFDDLQAAQDELNRTKGSQQVSVLLFGVQGLHPQTQARAMPIVTAT